MCGIIGYITNKKDSNNLKEYLKELYLLSERRGKEASGISASNSKEILTLKRNIEANKFIKTKEYNSLLGDLFLNTNDRNLSIIGHSRLVTNGNEKNNYNNQPVIKNDFVTVHNGIITNVDDIYKNDYKRKYEIDTEVINDLLGNISDLSITKINERIEGNYNVLIQKKQNNQLIALTNNGSLFYVNSKDKNEYIFASERSFLNSFCEKFQNFAKEDIQWLKPNTGIIIDEKLSLKPLNQNSIIDLEDHSLSKNIKDYSEYKSFNVNTENNYNPELLEYNKNEIRSLRRCTKCILPETFPFIEFDENGVCNYCNNYKPKVNFDIEQERNLKNKLLNIIEPHRSKNGKPDIVFPLSGGRDSSYGLHYITKELGLNPVTFTYDWGMVTPLARRNIARLCGELGVENILVSADLKKKRNNIRKNIISWLKNPQLGVVPLFMAGDKYFLYYVNQIKKDTGIDLNIWCGNRLEETLFKSGFANVPPEFNDKKWIFSMSFQNNIRLAYYYLKEYFGNYRYLNSSLFDTIGAFLVYYFSNRNDTYLLYDYVKWDEEKISDTLINQYNWELSEDTNSTWRIGDGTASFYNYIYYTIAGFSEVETFRSNQIREGMINRKEALNLAFEENRPRFESIKWYCDTIGIDFNDTINQINNIKKLYI